MKRRPPKKESAKDRPGTRLAREWQLWAAENLLRGVARDRIVASLREKGVAEPTIVRELAAIEASPIYEAARPFARDSRRSTMRVRLERALARAAHGQGDVPRRSNVSAAELHDVYVAGNRPVVLTDVVSRWPALGKWTPSWLAERFGDVVVDVTVDRDSDPDYDLNAEKHTIAMPLRELVGRIEAAKETNDFYLIARGHAIRKTAMRAVLEDVVLPEGYLDVARAKDGSALWLGPAGTVTPLHHDTSNILFGQVYGRKAWTLVSPSELLDDARSIYSPHDPEIPGALGDAIALRTTLAPGDALFVPVGWWHHVRALDASISLAFNNFTFPNDYEWYRPGQVR